MVPRTKELLHEIVEAYIRTGEPVASRSIAKRRGETLSAASIRNVMADLDEEGYLSQPHTSAGRIPTEKAFQSYVQSLRLRSLAAAELERLRAEIGKLDTIEQKVEYTSRILVDMTRGVGIAAAIPKASPALQHIELVSLPDQRVLMVVVTRDQEVRNRVVRLEVHVSPEELSNIRNYVNRNFEGWTLEDVRRAYRKLAKQLHPDANPGDAKTEAKFKELNEAYDVLKDPQKKAAYDRFGHQAFENGMGGGRGGAGFGDRKSTRLNSSHT